MYGFFDFARMLMKNTQKVSLHTENVTISLRVTSNVIIRNEKLTFLVGEPNYRVFFIHPHAKQKDNVQAILFNMITTNKFLIVSDQIFTCKSSKKLVQNK